MATLSPIYSLYSVSTPISHRNPSHCLTQNLHFQLHGFSKPLTLTNKNPLSHRITKLRAVEDETQIQEEEEEEEEEEEPQLEEQEQQTVSVPVSPSDTLTMYFQAEGMMNEASIPAVTNALEGTDSIADLKVKVVEGIASVELTKQTTVQATGVASSLVEVIQGAGFKLQTLNLSFADEEDIVVV